MFVVTVDEHQHFKSFVSQTTSIRLEPSSSNAEKSFLSHFKIANYMFLGAAGYDLFVW